jgi:hypothetical protein
VKVASRRKTEFFFLYRTAKPLHCTLYGRNQTLASQLRHIAVLYVFSVNSKIVQSFHHKWQRNVVQEMQCRPMHSWVPHKSEIQLDDAGVRPVYIYIYIYT